MGKAPKNTGAVCFKLGTGRGVIPVRLCGHCSSYMEDKVTHWAELRARFIEVVVSLFLPEYKNIKQL